MDKSPNKQSVPISPKRRAFVKKLAYQTPTLIVLTGLGSLQAYSAQSCCPTGDLSCQFTKPPCGPG